MKIAICGDVHMCKNSSIVRGRGEKFSQRLENCIDSINWFEDLSKQHECDVEVFLGDFFDSSMLDDETITAVREIKFTPDTLRLFIVGNHESSVNGLYYSSTSILRDCGRIISSYSKWAITRNIVLDFLPYILETDRKPLEEYIKDDGKRHIVFSHNDIAGVQMGKFLSKTGFTVDEINHYCELFINGHLHNHSEIGEKIINLGNITGQNFGEDALKYDHYAMILNINDDIEEVSIEMYRNPVAFNFYKLDATLDDVEVLVNFELKPNAVVSIKCYDNDVDIVGDWLSQNHVAESRTIIKSRSETNREELGVDTTNVSIDHIAKFVDACIEKFGHSDVLQGELEEIVGLV